MRWTRTTRRRRRRRITITSPQVSVPEVLMEGRGSSVGQEEMVEEEELEKRRMSIGLEKNDKKLEEDEEHNHKLD